MARHEDSKRTERAKRRAIERRQARACKHHVPDALNRSGRERQSSHLGR